MSTKYLLPCSCGEKTAVETSQAGQDIPCRCGKTLRVPTMQGIRRLEPHFDPVDESKARPAGGPALALALLGLLLLAVGAAWMYHTHNTRRPAFYDVDSLSPWGTWLMWQDLRDGVQLPEYTESPFVQGERIYRRYMTLGAVVTGLGTIMIAGAAVIAMLGRSAGGRKT